MVGWSCFCGEREPAQAAVRRSAKVLKAVPDLARRETRGRWLQTVGPPDARFNCRPS